MEGPLATQREAHRAPWAVCIAVRAGTPSDRPGQARSESTTRRLVSSGLGRHPGRHPDQALGRRAVMQALTPCTAALSCQRLSKPRTALFALELPRQRANFFALQSSAHEEDITTADFQATLAAASEALALLQAQESDAARERAQLVERLEAAQRAGQELASRLTAAEAATRTLLVVPGATQGAAFALREHFLRLDALLAAGPQLEPAQASLPAPSASSRAGHFRRAPLGSFRLRRHVFGVLPLDK